jgi:hypothetical protein
MARGSGELLKTYAVFAVGAEGVPLKLVETFWYRRAVRVFNAAKDSGQWTRVQVRLGARECMVYSANPERRARPRTPAVASPRSGPPAPHLRRVE